MNKALINGATHNPGAPQGQETTIGRLPIRREAGTFGGLGTCESAWKPTAEELRILNSGGFVLLTVVGWQVPVSLNVIPSTEATEL